MGSRDDYTFKGKLGRGGNGTVYKAIDCNDGGEVAIKRMHKYRSYTRNEVDVLRDLDHENIVAYLDHFYHRGKLHLVMEYCDGGTLQERVARQNEFHHDTYISLKKIHSWFKQTVSAIEYLHHQHIMHRDIKPANVLINEDDTLAGEVKLADFGISREVAETNATAYTMAGPYHYMSPQVYQGRSYTMKADIWSLGCLLYVLSELEIPFESIEDACNREFARPLSFSASPPELVDLIRDMLKIDEDDRLSIDEVVRSEFVMGEADQWKRSFYVR